MKAPAETHRTVQIHALSARREALAVGRAIFFLLYASAFVLSAELRAAPAGSEPLVLSSFERRFHDLDAEGQRIFRVLREGVSEAESRRDRRGAWPSVEELASEGIPPFAPDPLDRARYSWVRRTSDAVINYVGTPAPGTGREAVVVLITEPEPGTPIDPLAPVDEVHHRLADGAMLHVSVWMGPPLDADGAREAMRVLPLEKGFKQIVTSSARAP